MKVSTKTRYGLRALVEMAGHYGEVPVKRIVLSENQAIPMPYLENILTSLRIAGLIQTRRGSRGGLTLTRPPEDVNLLEVFNILEGSLAPVSCTEEPGFCDRKDNCPTVQVWQKLQSAQETVLRDITLADLLEKPKIQDFSI